MSDTSKFGESLLIFIFIPPAEFSALSSIFNKPVNAEGFGRPPAVAYASGNETKPNGLRIRVFIRAAPAGVWRRLIQPALPAEERGVFGGVGLAVIAGEFFAVGEFFAGFAKRGHGALVLFQTLVEDFVGGVGVFGINGVFGQTRFERHFDVGRADAEAENGKSVFGQPEQRDEFGRNFADAAGVAGGIAQAFGGGGGVLGGQRGVGYGGYQAVGAARRAEAAVAGAAAQAGAVEVGDENKKGAASADLRVGRLQGGDLRAQFGRGDVDDGVVLAVHPRGGLAGAVDDGLQVLRRQAQAAFEVAESAVVFEGFDSMVHGGFLALGERGF